MAIGKRSTDAVWYVCDFDPAIDKGHEAYDRKAYLERFDRAHLPLSAGCAATEFRIRPLTQRQYRYLLKLDGGDRVMETVAYGVEDVRGWADGQLQLKKKNTDIGQRLTEQALDEFFAPELFLELHEAITRISTLNPTNG